MLSVRLNTLTVILLAVLVFLQYKLWFQSGGIRDMLKIKNTLVIQENENEKLKHENEQLVSQIQHLRSSQDATESRARKELGMVKKGETFYQIVK